jgi:hypothetical protein
MSKKRKQNDLKNAGIHFKNAALECILGSAYLAKGIGDITKNRNYRQQILDSTYNLIDSGLSMFIKYAEEYNQKKNQSRKTKSKSSKQSRKIKID